MENKWLFDKHYCEQINLQDRTRLRIRPIRPADKTKLAETFRQLSSETRYRRCFSLKSELSLEELNFFCDVDGINHYALTAVLLDNDNQEGDGIGGVRFIRLAENAGIAELAFLVADAWQRKGIGRILMNRLTDAALERGISTLCCYLLAGNIPARQFIRNASQNTGWNITFHNEGTLTTVELAIKKSAPAELVTADVNDFRCVEAIA